MMQCLQQVVVCPCFQAHHHQLLLLLCTLHRYFESPEGQDSGSDTDSAKHGVTYNRMPHGQLVDLTKQFKREHKSGQRSIAQD